MKKATKLLLSILPISSISLLSVVSCSTTNSNAKQPNKKPEKPNGKDPIIPKKPDDKKPNNNDNNSNSNSNPNNKPDSTTPSENKNPFKPDKTPKTPDTNPKQPEENPKKPDKQPHGDDSNNNHPHNDQPADQPDSHKVDFSDVDKLPKEISFDNFEIYKKQDATSAWFDLKTKIKWIFEKVINDKEIINKYEVSFVNENDLVFVDEKGVIDRVSIKFTKDKQSKTRTFSFTGFKKRTNQVNKNNKENYIKPKNKVDKKLLGLHPSLVAYMLMYSQDHNNYRELLQSGNVINFEELENGNNNLFYSDSINLNVEMKDLLLEYDKSLGELYDDKIIGVRYDDINGILGLEVEITNRDDDPKTKDEPFSYKPKAFIFQGFRKIDFNNNDRNVLSINLLPSSLKEIVSKGNVKKKIDEFKKSGKKENKISFEKSTEPFFKQQLFKNLLVDINDNEHKIYRSTKTLSLHSSNGYTSIIGLTGNMSIYPFHSIITKDCINNISLVVNREPDNNYLITIDFDFDIPVFSSTFSDLKSHVASDSKTLKLKVSANTFIK
ncbi:LppA family lipoprotein [Mycoplasma mycoides]|uniref:LppA family lipoprotein n=1 Tax=Mycoplasma mycoides TaxID=2102 RepID=UPI002734644D|nr:LppA family lipoprotein [Mycoplasma mycoides]MDP4040729.1 LppA family lipoprotein [Mycoplasma mycoides]MDP4041588.1 LppA family lipoprotein [Mycoplasma mycoides]MDP4042474.1 LppA family lipoprotein [Mycoplasma mycoides]MDP4043948.1 LppA family lipoprotein [Mycoplasma mycoides]MDP4044870.1 LppA family lipoprotein [Mycoplasma mycoides]